MPNRPLAVVGLGTGNGFEFCIFGNQEAGNSICVGAFSPPFFEGFIECLLLGTEGFLGGSLRPGSYPGLIGDPEGPVATVVQGEKMCLTVQNLVGLGEFLPFFQEESFPFRIEGKGDYMILHLYKDYMKSSQV